MCTAIIEVSDEPTRAVRLLAVRDEDPNRPWDPPGEWWPDNLPGVTGVRDRLANGAWLATHSTRGTLAVLLNRVANDGSHSHAVDPEAAEPALKSRGMIVLASAEGESVSEQPGTANFNLIEIHGHQAMVTYWDGETVTRSQLQPGVHMIAHQNIDDVSTPRIARWLPEFQTLAGLPDERWREAWNALLTRTTELDLGDDRAIIRDNRVHGYPTQSLLVCTAEVHGDRVDLASTVLPASLR